MSVVHLRRAFMESTKTHVNPLTLANRYSKRHPRLNKRTQLVMAPIRSAIEVNFEHMIQQEVKFLDEVEYQARINSGLDQPSSDRVTHVTRKQLKYYGDEELSNFSEKQLRSYETEYETPEEFTIETVLDKFDRGGRDLEPTYVAEDHFISRKKLEFTRRLQIAPDRWRKSLLETYPVLIEQLRAREGSGGGIISQAMREHPFEEPVDDEKDSNIEDDGNDNPTDEGGEMAELTDDKGGADEPGYDDD